jgi:hypothetical protein
MQSEEMFTNTSHEYGDSFPVHKPFKPVAT